MHGDWVAATASVIAAIIGGAIAYTIARYQATKQKIRFYVDDPQDLAGGLKAHGQFFQVKIGDQITEELIASEIIVSNVGNVMLQDVTFDIVIPGSRKLAKTNVISSSRALQSKVQIDFPATMPPIDPYFSYRLPFFNVGESFNITCFFDGPASSVEVHCRLPSVSVETITRAQWEKKSKAWALRWTFVMAAAVFLSIAFQAIYFFNHRGGATVSFGPPNTTDNHSD